MIINRLNKLVLVPILLIGCSEYVEVTAHRGASGLAPENTIASVKKAIDKLQHEKIVNPSDIFSPRVNSSGYDLSEPKNLLDLKSNLLKFNNLKVEAKN